MTDRFVIGVTGPIGSGVSTVAAALQDLGFLRIKISDIIRSEMKAAESSPSEGGVLPLKYEEGPNTRKSAQDFGNDRREKDPTYWVKKCLEQDVDAKETVIESIRNPAEAEWLRQEFGPSFFLLAVHATRETRWARVKQQYEQDEAKFDRDDARDSEEDITYGQQVDKCVELSDYVYVRDEDAGASESRKEKIKADLKDDLHLMRNARTLDKSIRRSFRPATKDEVQMATAYAQSQQSCCIKRRVGAVVLGNNDLPLSLGFNENPINMKPCIHEYRHCFKDDEMHKALEAIRKVYCPVCGQENSSLLSPWLCSNQECNASLKSQLFPSRNMELCTAIHAEERAIRSLGGRDVAGGTLYTTTFPCFQCSRYIVDAGIKRVVYVEAYPVKQAAEFLRKNDVNVEPFRGFKAIAFNQIFRQVQ